MTIKEPTTKIYPELAKKADGDGENLDDSGERENRVFDMEGDEEENKNDKKGFKKNHGGKKGAQQGGFWSKLFSICRRNNEKQSH